MADEGPTRENEPIRTLRISFKIHGRPETEWEKNVVPMPKDFDEFVVAASKLYSINEGDKLTCKIGEYRVNLIENYHIMRESGEVIVECHKPGRGWWCVIV